jgi:pimeloyl-ACP methyl ester carboxylesterase
LALESHYISFRSSRIHYTRSGHGSEWLFCFHGYGEDSNAFRIFEAPLGERFTLITIDMPFHGKTDWQEELLFEPADLITIIDLIKPKDQPMHILGYSMGGRIGLYLLQCIPDQVAKLVLVAPDGLHNNKWQWIATHTKAGNQVFSYTMQNPFWMVSLMKLSGRIGLYNKSLLKFAFYYLGDKNQRLILYKRWTTMRKFKPEKELLKKIIAKKQKPVEILFGRYDRVILAKYGRYFAQNNETYIHVTEIEAGHRLLGEKYMPLIVRLLVE